MNKLFTLKQVAKNIGTTEEILFEYFRRKEIVSVYTKEFIEPMNQEFYHISEKGSQRNNNTRMSNRCYLTKNGLEYFQKLSNKISFDKFYKKSQLEKRRNIKLCKEIYSKEYSFKVDSDEWYGFKEFDFFAKYFTGYKDRYTINEVCNIFKISEAALFYVFASCNWLCTDTALFHPSKKYMGVCNYKRKKIEGFKTILNYSYVTFDGLINISALLRVSRGCNEM